MNGTHSGSDPDHSTSRSGTDTTIGPLTVAEAAALLGVEPRTVIKYRQQGKIRGEKQGKAWQLWLAQTFIDVMRTEHSGMRSGTDPERQHDRSGSHSGLVEGTYRVTPSEIEQAIERTGAKYVADMAGLYDRISVEVRRLYEAQLMAKDETIATQREALATQAETVVGQRETIADLRRWAEVAEAEVARRQEVEAARRARAAAVQVERQRLTGVRRSGLLMPDTLDRVADALEEQDARDAQDAPSASPPPPTRWARLRAFLHGDG